MTLCFVIWRFDFGVLTFYFRILSFLFCVLCTMLFILNGAIHEVLFICDLSVLTFGRVHVPGLSR